MPMYYMMETNSYLSLTDILVTNEKVPCTFLHDLPKMGFMDPSSSENDIKMGSKVEIPLWLAEPLHMRRLISVDMPKIYREAYREIFNADSCTIDMHKLGQYFYEVGCYVAKHDVKGEVALMLINAFRQRFRMLMCASVSSDSVGCMQPLSASERVRASAAMDTEGALCRWLQRGESLLTTANMVSSHRKRKRVEMEML